MDLDEDGIPDLVSGSYTKGVFFFKGLGGGKFAKPVNLMDTEGRVINPSQALAPAFGDWSGSGHMDMILGTINGPVYFFKNNGHMAFKGPQQLKADGKVIDAPDGGPCVYDLNRDGIPDLILGDGGGGLAVYYGTRRGSLDLRTGEKIIVGGAALWQPQACDPKTGEPARPGVRLKPSICDWNGDGKPDLIMGDFLEFQPVVKKLNPAQTARRDRLRKESQDLSRRVQKRLADLTTKARAQVKATRVSPTEEERKLNATLMTIQMRDKPLRALQQRWTEAAMALQQYEPVPVLGGCVWVLLGK